jgi:hypothetical protein
MLVIIFNQKFAMCTFRPISIIIVSLLVAFFNIAYAAVDPIVYIQGDKASSIYDGIDFYGLTPSNTSYLNEYFYNPVIVKEINNSTVPDNAAVTYEWIAVGGSLVSANNVVKVDVKWNNTKNYNNGIPTKSLRLKVTFTWTPQGGTKQTKVITSIRANGANEAQPIEVKYISDPSTITFNGSTLSNGNTLLFSCGATQKTLSISAVTTDPFAGVTYFFIYPDGWSGPASSSVPTVTVNTPINKPGTIKVEAKRNDTNNFRTKISINITRPVPTIPVINSGSILLCNPVTITASANYATSYKWTTTGGITANSPGNTNSAQISGVSDGTVAVAAVSSVCAVTSSYSSPVAVKRSAPKPASLLVTENGGGSPDFMCNGSGVSLHAETAEPGTAFGAWVSSDPANTFLNFNGGSAYFNSYVNSCYGITVSASNCFGSVQKGITICVDNCAKGTIAYEVYPNPAHDLVHIKFNGENSESHLPDLIRIISEVGGKEVRSIDPKPEYSTSRFISDKILDIDVSSLKAGTYYLQLLKHGAESQKVRIALQ